MDALGSPPRAWGQCLARTLMPRERRFTPTGVGTIVCGAAAASGSTVHPHGRGDNLIYEYAATLHGGSPPRAWGQ